MKANIDSVDLRYEDSGSGPAVLVIHDDANNKELNQLFAPLAEAGYRVVVTNLDGFGKRRTGNLDLPFYARQAVSLLNFLGIGRAVIFGIGLGGAVLLELLETSADRVAASSLVLEEATSRRIRELTSRPEIHTALQQGSVQSLKEELPAVLLAAGKEKAVRSSLPQLRNWIAGVQSRIHYLSAIHHRSALLADMEIPPMILEADQDKLAEKSARKSLVRRGWKKIIGVNGHLAALLQAIIPDDEEEDEPVSHLR